VGSIFGRTHAGSRGLHDGYRAYAPVKNISCSAGTRDSTYLRCVVGNGSGRSLVVEVRLSSIAATLAAVPSIAGQSRPRVPSSSTNGPRVLSRCPHNSTAPTNTIHGCAPRLHAKTLAASSSHARELHSVYALSAADSLASTTIAYNDAHQAPHTRIRRRHGNIFGRDAQAGSAAPIQRLF
jgi:hypothetical protein